MRDTPMTFVPLNKDANDWMATRTKAQMLQYADRKMMPRGVVLEVWRSVRKRLAEQADKSG
jgi:hypothetical protein